MGCSRHIIGPAISWFGGLIYLDTRSSMLEVLRKDYVRTARSKGLSEKLLLTNTLERMLNSCSNYCGQMVIGLLTGVVIVEIFCKNRLSSFAATAAQQLDYASIMGVLLFTSLLLIIGI